MSSIQEIDTGILYNDIEKQLLENTSGIMLKLVESYAKMDLASMSIDKTESVLKIVDSVEKNINKRANLALKLMAVQDTNNDRERLIDIITNIELRKANSTSRSGDIEIEDVEVEQANVDIARGELTTGIEQLSLELLDLENKNEGEW